MILEETIKKLLDLKMGAMVDALRELMNKPPGHKLSFEEQLGLLIEREWTDRQNKALARRLKQAKLGQSACLEDVRCEPERGLDKAVVRGLSSCQWVRSKQNVIVIGRTGVGKSYLGSALAQAACRNGFRALCTRVPRLLHELAIARADGTYVTVLNRIAQVHVLILDDLLITPLKDTERRDLLEILEDRYGKSSTVITSQLPTKKWHEALSDPTLADAICDRVVHNAHVLALRGPSIRERNGMNENKEKSPEEDTKNN
jgi:DNA replication protein DnaC